MSAHYTLLTGPHAARSAPNTRGDNPPMKDTLYKVVRFLGSPFVYHCIGLENIQGRGPAIYVANHLVSVGPVEIILSLPVRLYPWVIAVIGNISPKPRVTFSSVGSFQSG